MQTSSEQSNVLVWSQSTPSTTTCSIRTTRSADARNKSTDQLWWCSCRTL